MTDSDGVLSMPLMTMQRKIRDFTGVYDLKGFYVCFAFRWHAVLFYVFSHCFGWVSGRGMHIRTC